MKTWLSVIFGFIAGVCAAIIVALYHDIMSTQPQPTMAKRWVVEQCGDYVEYGGIIFNKPTINPDLCERLLDAALTALEAQEKTQPIVIEEEYDGPQPWDQDYVGGE